MKYFKDINTIEDATERLKELRRTFHPDKGGSEETFKEIESEFKALQERFMMESRGYVTKAPKKAKRLTEIIENITPEQIDSIGNSINIAVDLAKAITSTVQSFKKNNP